MKKWIKIIILSFLALTLLPACMHSSEDQLKAFDQHMKIVNEKERVLSKTLNQMDLNQIHYLSQTDTTDKNKQAFNDIKKAIDQKLKPKFKDYREAANQLPARDDSLKALKSTYLKGIDQKEHEIKQLDLFIALCQKSIQSNEKILDSTQAFEKHRSRVESQMNLAKQTEQGSRESEMLENKLISNNQAIKEIAEKSMNAKSEKAQLDAIHKEMLPLIQG
ncbi:EMYY motif lipoprotein [Staphylococcus schleiferi]|nr:EMYY motif lipoprotein [Staphylococcus schleiferi]